jgi:membrane-associated phospholipid phosphatase
MGDGRNNSPIGGFRIRRLFRLSPIVTDRLSPIVTDRLDPSSHSTLAWALAAVVASEYPSKWVQLGVYSMASSVSLTRVLGQEHFPTDVLVGGVAGWLIGHYVARKHPLHQLK